MWTTLGKFSVSRINLSPFLQGTGFPTGRFCLLLLSNCQRPFNAIRYQINVAILATDAKNKLIRMTKKTIHSMNENKEELLENKINENRQRDKFGFHLMKIIKH